MKKISCLALALLINMYLVASSAGVVFDKTGTWASGSTDHHVVGRRLPMIDNCQIIPVGPADYHNMVMNHRYVKTLCTGICDQNAMTWDGVWTKQVSGIGGSPPMCNCCQDMNLASPDTMMTAGKTYLVACHPYPPHLPVLKGLSQDLCDVSVGACVITHGNMAHSIVYDKDEGYVCGICPKGYQDAHFNTDDDMVVSSCIANQ